MKPDSKSVLFRGLAEQLQTGCARRGVHLPGGVAELILADRINAVAAQLRISDHHAMRTYFGEDTIAELVDLCLRARAEQDCEIEQASPMLLPLPHAATIVGALAVTCQAATTASHRTESATAVIEATAAIVGIAGAIARAGDAGLAIIDAEAVVIARTQLKAMIDHLGNGTWQVPGHENLPDGRENDLAMRDRIDHDLQLLQ